VNKKIEKALNKQINAELYSSYLYYSMSAYFHTLNLEGMASWMKVQTQEEMVHANMFNDYVLERGGTINLTTIDGPKTKWDSPLAAFEDAYAHEKKVTSLINNLVDIALQESDHATNAFLQWFVSEQVEEEAAADSIVQKLKLVGKNGSGIFMIDQQLQQRSFTAPPNAPTLP